MSPHLIPDQFAKALLASPPMGDETRLEGGDMDEKILDIKAASELIYGRCTKSTRNMLGRKCANKEIKHARKINGSWRINVTREWPELF